MQYFNEYLQSKDLSQASQGLYTRYVNDFLNWYAHHRQNDPINCTKKDIIAYLAYLQDIKNYQSVTRRNMLMAVGYYYTALLQAEQVHTNPTSFIKLRGTNRKKLYYTFNYEELQQLYDDYYHTFLSDFDRLCFAPTKGGIQTNQITQTLLSRQRNYNMLGLLLFQGLQTKELQKIQLEHLDLNKAQVYITAGTKRVNARYIPLNASQIGALMLYLHDTRPKLLHYQREETNQLFLPLPEVSKDLTDRTDLMHTLKPLSRHTKTLHKNFINFYQVRASVITYWIKTVGLRKAQYLAGHRYINTTERYLPNDLESLTEDITKFNPF